MMTIRTLTSALLTSALVALLIFPFLGGRLNAAESTTAVTGKAAPQAPPVTAASAGTNAPVAGHSFTGRIVKMEAAANTLAFSTSYGLKTVRFSVSTLSKLGGVPVKASDFKIGEFLVVRGHLEGDSVLVAEFASNRLPTPTMKPVVKKEPPTPDKK